MRKSKAISIMTSLAMTGTMVMSALSFTADAAATNPLGLKLTCDQTQFTSADAGKLVTVYVDTEGTVTEADKVGSVEFKLKSDSWGKLDPIDLILSPENGLETSKGNTPKTAFNQTGTMVISQWDDAEKPSKPGYAIQKYNDVAEFTGYTDDYCPAALVMSDSSHGFLKTSASTKHVAEFKVKVPSAEGKYSLSLIDAKSMICVDGEFGSNSSELINSPTAQGITFTVGSGSTGTDTPTPTPTPTPSTGDPDPNRKYDGDANIKIGDAAAAAGETLSVPVYLELTKADPQYITGIGFKVVYDTTALELVDMKDGDGFISEGGFNYDTETGVFLYTFTTEDIKIDPTKPIGTLDFKVKSTAKDGSYKINVINHLYGADAPLQIIHVQEYMKDTTYLTPHVTQGTVTVGAGGNTDDILWGDANLDGKVNVRDAAYIAKLLATGKGDTLPINADYNRDDKKNVRDAAAIAKALAKGEIKK